MLEIEAQKSAWFTLKESLYTFFDTEGNKCTEHDNWISLYFHKRWLPIHIIEEYDNMYHVQFKGTTNNTYKALVHKDQVRFDNPYEYDTNADCNLSFLPHDPTTNLDRVLDILSRIEDHQAYLLRIGNIYTNHNGGLKEGQFAYDKELHEQTKAALTILQNQ